MVAQSAVPEGAPAKQTSDAKKRLIDSALALFAEKGYDGTSIREIIERAGVTRPVLYYYFENKEDLFRRLVQTHFSEIIHYIDDIIATVPACRDRLNALISNTFERTERVPQATALILQVCFTPPQRGPQLDKDVFVLGRFQRVTRIMQDGLESGELAGGDAATLAVFFSGMMDMHVMAKTYLPTSKLSAEFGKRLVDLFIQGASSPGWAQIGAHSPFTFDVPSPALEHRHL